MKLILRCARCSFTLGNNARKDGPGGDGLSVDSKCRNIPVGLLNLLLRRSPAKNQKSSLRNGYRIFLTAAGRSFLVAGLIFAGLVTSSRGVVVVNSPADAAALQAALSGTRLTITSVSIRTGEAGQFGTYTGFTNAPITIENGVVLSSGEVAFVGPPPDPVVDYPEPSYEMGSLGTPEFDAYGPGHIENFSSSHDVAALQVDFHLDTNSPVKFDFVFGSVEYPFWTSDFTDALLVFLDGTDPTNQIAFDKNNQPVQVGNSFAGLVVTSDANTTFAAPHGMLVKLTTTTARLAPGDHTLIFEVGDVNDTFLDSAAFIANLRAEEGVQGTEPTDPPPPLVLKGCQSQNNTNCVSLTWMDNGVAAILEESDTVTGGWNAVSTPWTTNGIWLQALVNSTNSTGFFRLRKQ
jgi:hypothetical protein